jgi:hypothetical protein
MRISLSLGLFSAVLAVAAVGCAAAPATDEASSNDALTVGSPPAPTFCQDGEIETVPSWIGRRQGVRDVARALPDEERLGMPGIPPAGA